MRGLYTQVGAEARHMPNPHAAAINEINNFRRLAESQHVWGRDAVMRCQRSDVALPPKLCAGTELVAPTPTTRGPLCTMISP
jgi:hypothetical protein